MTLLQLIVLNACHFGPKCHDFSSEHVIISMMILVVYGLTYKLYTHRAYLVARSTSEIPIPTEN
jgi:hypothetical protein